MRRTRDRATTALLVGAYATAIVASWWHLAETFATLERPGRWYIGALAATAVDLGLAVLALALAHQAHHGRPTRDLMAATVLFAAISALANLDHALTVLTGATPTTASVAALDPLALGRAVVFSATLPVLVVVLAHVVDRMAAPSWAPTRVAAGTGQQAGRTTTANTKKRSRPPTGGANGRQRPPTPAERAAIMGAITDNPGATWPELAEAVGRPRTTVQRWVGVMLDAGQLGGGPGDWRVSENG